MRTGSIERLVMIFPGALGDFLLALPALRGLCVRVAAPRATLVVSSSLAALARHAGPWEWVADLDGAEAAWLFGGTRRPAWLAGAPRIVSWLGARDRAQRERVAGVAAGVRFLSVERGGGAVHAAVAYARGAGLSLDARVLARAARIDPPPSVVACSVLDGLERPVLAVHPGAGSRAKRWDAAGFVQVAEAWRRAGGGLLEIAGPAEAGETSLLGGRIARDLPLSDLAALLGGVDAYLGNDSGVTHLAAAVGVRGIALFGPTSSRRWRPIGQGIRPLQASPPGADGISLAALPPARVVAALRRQFVLTSGRPDISVPPSPPPGVSDGPRCFDRQE